MRWILYLLLGLVCSFLLTNSSVLAVQAQLSSRTDPAIEQSEKAAQASVVQNSSTSVQDSSALVVGVYQAPPFAIKQDGNWQGIGVDLWQQITENLGLSYRWQELNPNQVIEQVEQGTVDLAIVAIASATDEQRVNFTPSYYTTSLGVAERQERGILEIITAVFSPQFLRITFWLSIVLVVIGVLAWAFERNSNDQFEKSPIRGIWTGFWWAGVTMSTIGYGDKTPKTVPGRILALLWMLIAMGITATLTASITSVLAINVAQPSQFPQSLWQMQVGTVPGSATAEYLQQERIQFQPFSTPSEGMQAVQDRDIEVFVYSAAPLKYLNRQSLKGNLNIRSTEVQARRYAFALPNSSDLYDVMKQQVLQETSESSWQELVKRYVPEEQESG